MADSGHLSEPCAVCGSRASHEYTPPLYAGRLLLCNECNPTHSPTNRDADGAAVSHFFVYAITFDQDTFGIYATRVEAEAALARQIAEGGPAWEDCKVERWARRGGARS